MKKEETDQQKNEEPTDSTTENTAPEEKFASIKTPTFILLDLAIALNTAEVVLINQPPLLQKKIFRKYLQHLCPNLLHYLII